MTRPLALSPEHPLWPDPLRSLPPESAPAALRVLGAWPPEGRAAVAVVGSRAATRDGVALARRFGRELAAAGIVVWSGGAVGIDAAAHEGALEAGGATVAVLGGGLGAIFPPENAPLFDRIVASGRGALVACCGDAEKATRPRFFARNRVIAACAGALVVVECGLWSGARNAAAAARELGRPVAVVPFTPGTGLPGGALELTRLGARPVFDVDDVLALLGAGVAPTRGRRRAPRGASPAPPRAAKLPADPLARAVLEAIAEGPLHRDAIGARAGLGAAAVAQALFALVVEGLAHEVSPGLWGRAVATPGGTGQAAFD